MQAMEGCCVKLSIRQPARLAWLAVLIAAGAMLLSASGAQAAANRGAVLVKDINAGRSGSSSGYIGGCYACYAYGGPFASVGGTLYLSVDDGKHGYELWRSDGTGKGTRMVKDINPGPGSSYVYGATVVNRILYFAADDGVHGFELWRSDGTAPGTMMVKDINPGADTSYFEGGIAIGGILYFWARGGLWRSDGTEAGTSLVKQLSGGLYPIIDVNGTLYFGLFDGGHSGLWRSDGTEAGTILVKQGFLGTLEFTNFNGALYFSGNDGVHGTALWRSDGTQFGTTMVKEFNTTNPSLPCCFFEANSILYFLSSDAAYALDQLWRSDGTAAGTILLKRGFFELSAVKSILYLAGARGLWRSDGTPRGTKLVRKGVVVVSLTAAKKTLYFVGTDKQHGEEVWRSDGTRKGTNVARDIRRGPASSHPQDLTAVGGTLFFTAKEGKHGRELWRAGPKPCTTAKGKCKKG
ncbi:MAG: ELWxxDGT repeat protein [Solirubrobacterales bacterium]